MLEDTRHSLTLRAITVYSGERNGLHINFINSYFTLILVVPGVKTSSFQVATSIIKI